MTSNPMTQGEVYNGAVLDGEPMTVSGAVNKTILLLAITAVVGAYTWVQAFSGYMDKVSMLVWGGIIAGLVLAIIMRFKPQNAKVLSIAYAACEGLAIGGISAMYEAQLSGIVANAALVTFITLFAMLFLYKANIIRATDRFRSVVVTATVGIMIFYLISLVVPLPVTCCSSRSNSNTTFLLLSHPVHCCGTVMHLTYLVCLTGVEENTLRRCGLSGIDVSHDTDVTSQM